MKATSEELAIFVARQLQPGGRAAWTGQFRCQPGS